MEVGETVGGLLTRAKGAKRDLWLWIKKKRAAAGSEGIAGRGKEEENGSELQTHANKKHSKRPGTKRKVSNQREMAGGKRGKVAAVARESPLSRPTNAMRCLASAVAGGLQRSSTWERIPSPRRLSFQTMSGDQGG